MENILTRKKMVRGMPESPSNFESRQASGHGWPGVKGEPTWVHHDTDGFVLGWEKCRSVGQRKRENSFAAQTFSSFVSPDDTTLNAMVHWFSLAL